MAARFRKPFLCFIIFSLLALEILSLTIIITAQGASLERGLALFLNIFDFILILKYLLKRCIQGADNLRPKIGPVCAIKKYQVSSSVSQTLRGKQCRQQYKSLIFTAITCILLVVFVTLCLLYPLCYQNEGSLFLSTYAVFCQNGYSTGRGWSIIFELLACLVSIIIALINIVGLIYSLKRRFNKRPQQPTKFNSISEPPPSRSLSLQDNNAPSNSFTIARASTTAHSFTTKRKQQSSTDSLCTYKKKRTEELFKIPELSEKEELNTNYSRSKRLIYSQILNPNIAFFSNCFLCLGRFTSQAIVYKMKRCKHHFHLRCISEWDRKFTSMRDFCPECLQRRKQ